ncbi:hypothetical protein [Ferrimonas lipolytica]|uniref:Cytochrome oxidase Cu insertion factor, SCO1/SenC/PrrC family n=1 Tax=Ferrimonas lipolytica TaxID=2724191 RepID=A0A6H1UKR6_9GAMM|nr:hypothetical protein [Ferrimonas lipolytica]QIZ78392.1 hypothetical protein HER31_16680 [Ferrimonas lipolytica]
MSATTTGTSKRTLLLLLTLFSLPVLLAALVLNMGWYTGGSTNNGQLLTDISYQQLQQDNPQAQKWQMITFVPSQCDATCEAHLQELGRAHIALGRYQDRVIPIAYSLAPLSLPKPFTTVTTDDVIEQSLASYAVVVVDPMGQWVLGYQADQTREMLIDLRKLLKLSRIG